VDWLANFEDERAWEVLAAQIDSFHRSDSTAKALIKVGPRAEKFVLARYHRENGEIWESTKSVLKAYNTKREAYLEQALEDLDNEKKIGPACRTLREKGPDEKLRERACPALAKLMEHANPDIRNVSSEALAVWVTKSQTDLLLPFIANKDRGVRDRTYAMLKKVADDTTREKICLAAGRQLDSPDDGARRQAAECFAELAAKDQLDTALTRLGDKDRDTRRLMLSVVKKFPDDKSVAPLADALAFPEQRKEVAKLLTGYGDKAEADVLRVALSTKDNVVANTAIDILAEVGKTKQTYNLFLQLAAREPKKGSGNKTRYLNDAAKVKARMAGK